MKTSESITEINKALVGFHNDIKQPLKDKANPFFKSKYVPLENIAEVIDEVAPKHGLAYLQEAFTTDTGQTGVVTRLVHESGEFYETEPLALNADKNNAQGQGSVITYARRYQLASLFGVTSDEDDDGNKASENAPSYKQRVNDAYASTQSAGKCADCKGDIIAVGTITADQIKEGTQKTYGADLCWNCANIRKKEKADVSEG